MQNLSSSIMTRDASLNISITPNYIALPSVDESVDENNSTNSTPTNELTKTDNIYNYTGGDIDGSGFSTLEVIIGADNVENIISAGSGGSSLWGGIGGNDILIGGSGEDNFFYGKYDGADVISDAASNDVVNLYDIRLEEIIECHVDGNAIYATFNGGGTIQINSAENMSATIKLADGTSWQYNHSLNDWQER